jgi:hypothetical protein
VPANAYSIQEIMSQVPSGNALVAGISLLRNGFTFIKIGGTSTNPIFLTHTSGI